MRPSGRAADQLRPVALDINVNKYAEGSCLAAFGDTRVLCTATVEDRVPGFMKGSGRGWVTAEYGMLPRATDSRTDREAATGKQSGRTQEIQRLVGRSLRAVTDLGGFGERTVKIDCDVLQADGGTRTASITGGFVALHLAFQHLKRLRAVPSVPVRDHVAAISCGIFRGTPVLDLDYQEDSNAEADANFVITGSGGLVEVQATAEKSPFEQAAFDRMLELARMGIAQLVAAQQDAISKGP